MDDTERLLQHDVLEGKERGTGLIVSEEEVPKPTSPQQVSEPILMEVAIEPIPPKELILIEDVHTKPIPKESIPIELPTEPMPSEVVPKESNQLSTEPIPEQEVPPYLVPVDQAPPATISVEDVLEESECPEQATGESIPVDGMPASPILVSQIPAEPIFVEEELLEAENVEQILIDTAVIDEVLAEMEQIPMTSISAEEIPNEANEDLQPPEQALMQSVSAEQPVIEKLLEERLTEPVPVEIVVEEHTAEHIPMEQAVVENEAEKLSLPARTIDLDQLTVRIESLKADYKAAVASLTTLAPGTDGRAEETQIENVKVDQRLTKSQNELAMQEDKLWTNFITSLGPFASELDEKFEEDVNTLLDQSHTLSQSFQHRSNAPVPRTYQESKEILRAMGIPCIDATGAIEAEGLASSIVLAGLADYVASEDSVKDLYFHLSGSSD